MKNVVDSINQVQKNLETLDNPAIELHRNIANLLQIANDLRKIRQNVEGQNLGLQARQLLGLAPIDGAS